MQLTVAEYNTWYTQALQIFAKSQEISWQETLYKVRKGYKISVGIRLFLFCYALSTWEHSDTAVNYLTEEQVQSIINKINQAKWT